MQKIVEKIEGYLPFITLGEIYKAVECKKFGTKSSFLNFFTPISVSAIIFKPSKNCKSVIDSRLSNLEMNISDLECESFVIQSKRKCKGEQESIIQPYLVVDTNCKKFIVPDNIDFEVSKNQILNGPLYFGDPDKNGTWRFIVNEQGQMNLQQLEKVGEQGSWKIAETWGNV